MTVCRSLLSASTRASTSVLATDTATPKTWAAGHSHPNARPRSAPRTVDRTLRNGARDSHAPYRQQLLDVKLQADTEHQQDDADFCQLLRQRGIGHEPWGMGSDNHSGKQVPYDRREAETLRQVAENQRCGETTGERQNEVIAMHVNCACVQRRRPARFAGQLTSIRH